MRAMKGSLPPRLAAPVQLAAPVRVLLWAALGTLAGVGAGALVGVFGLGVNFFCGLGAENFSLLVWFLPAAGVLTVFMVRRWGGRGAGMGAAFAAARGEAECFPLRNAAFQFAGTWGAHLFCASVGREGAAMQIGAAVGNGIARALPPWAGLREDLTVAGLAAGFAALFGTPVCALFFALEVTVLGGLRLRAFPAAAFAAFAAFFTAKLCGGAAFTAEIAFSAFDAGMFWRLLLLGALCGLAGLLFCLLRRYSQRFLEAAVPCAYLRVAAAGAALACLLYLSGGRYAGLGTNLTEAALGGGQVYAFDWAVKIAFTAVTLAAGFLGGEVTTFFAAGACLGAVCGPLLGIPAAEAAALGYAAVFGAATNTLVAPVLLCCEAFGGAAVLPAAVACAAAYICNFGRSVYAQRPREGVWRGKGAGGPCTARGKGAGASRPAFRGGAYGALFADRRKRT